MWTNNFVVCKGYWPRTLYQGIDNKNGLQQKSSSISLLSSSTQNDVWYLAGVVLDAEAVVRQAVVSEELWTLAEATLKVQVFSADGVQFVQEGLIGDRPRPQALLVQHGQDAILVL